MKSKSIILMAVSLGFGLVAAIGISQVMGRSNKAAPKTKTRPVLVATEHIEIHKSLTKENTKVEQWPLEIAPEGAIGSLEEANGMVLRRDVTTKMAIVMGNVVSEDEVGWLRIPRGYKVFGIKVPAEDHTGLLAPGDHVDIIGTVITPDKKIRSKTFLKNIRVLSVNSKMIAGVDERGAGGSKGSTVVNVLVTQRQAEKLVLYQRAAQIKLVLLGHQPNEELPSAEEVDKQEGFASDDLFGSGEKKTASNGSGKLGSFLKGMMGSRKSTTVKTTGSQHTMVKYGPDGPTSFIFSRASTESEWGRMPKVIEGYASPSASKSTQSTQPSKSESKSDGNNGSSENDNSPDDSDSDSSTEES